MPTRQIVLTDHQDAVIRSLIADGRYHSADDVLQDGLRMIERREAQTFIAREGFCSAGDVGHAALPKAGRADFTGRDCWITQLNCPSGTD